MNYYSLLRPLLAKLDGESAHLLAIKSLKLGLVPAARVQHNPILTQTLWGMEFSSPVGLAAGFDKNAEVWNATLKQGFGFVEVGTVTPRPQPGNAKPRVFRLAEDEAVINRYGFNNVGMEQFAANLAPRGTRRGIVGINIGKNKDTVDAAADYLALLLRLYTLADYIVVNISSPNTAGLRALQEKSALADLLSALMEKRNQLAAKHHHTVPLLLKIAPDITDADKQDIAQVVLDKAIDGLIISNTTITRADTLQSVHKAETGGLSGKPLFAASTQLLADMYTLTGGRIPLIGVGGISSGEDAYRKILAGASLVQLYTALTYQGFALVERINHRLVELLTRDGYTHIREAVGRGELNPKPLFQK